MFHLKRNRSVYNNPAKMHYFNFLLAGLILGAESRFLKPPSFEETLQWSPKIDDPETYFGSPDDEELDNLFASAADTDTDDEEDDSANDWLKKLKSTLEEISREQDNPVTTTTESSRFFQSPNSFKNLIDSVDQLFDYPEGRDHERRVKSRYDFSAIFPFIDEDLQTSETNKKDKHDKELDSMLVEFQNQINRLRKYLGKHCRKQKSSPSPFRKIFGADQDWFISPDSSEPKNMSMLQ